MVKISWCFFRLSAQGWLMLPAWKKSHHIIWPYHFISKWRVRPRLRLIVLTWHLFLNFSWNRYKKLDNTSKIFTYLRYTHKKNILNKYEFNKLYFGKLCICNCLIFLIFLTFICDLCILGQEDAYASLIFEKKVAYFFGVSFSHKSDR